MPAVNPSFKETIGRIGKSLWRDFKDLEQGVEQEAEEIEEAKTKAASDGLTTTNTNYGAELQQDAIYKDQMNEMVVAESSLLALLPGNHGEINAPSANVPVKGRVGLFKKGSESGGSTGTNVTGDNSMDTGEVTLPIKKFDTKVFISIEELQYATDRQLMQTVRQKILTAGAETITSLIINGDTQTNTATGNVNHKDNGTPTALDTTQHYLHLDNGLRKVGIANTAYGSLSPAALSRTTYQNMLLGLGDYADDEANLLWLLSSRVGVNARYVDGYKTMDQIGDRATNRKGGIPAQIEGSDVFRTRHMASAVNSAGYVEKGSTPANNYSQLELIYRPAVQYAMGHPMRIVTHETAGGYTLDIAMWFGFVIVNQKANLDKTVSMAIVA